jgi:UDP-N-acetylmuramoyl-tripeptide--D-alanyl-D-alanine ligase
MTWRATRVAAVAATMAAACWLVWCGLDRYGVLHGALTAGAILVAGMPLLLIGANTLLGPYERYAQRAFEAEAVARIRQVQPFIIGITGSYGKSSTKAMLGHVLQFHAPTLAASGSINTLMGVTRHVREQLVAGHQFMVVEMGAFKTGSIRRLCRLTPPTSAIITAVGDMHLERFGSTDAIVRAKSELAEALPRGSTLVVNADSPGARKIGTLASHCRVLLYGETAGDDLDTRLEHVQFSRSGTSFTLRTREGTYACFTPLLGRPIVLNLAGAFTLASALGVDRRLLMAAMRTLSPVSNRLEVVDEGGITWIRDAYNSNRFGFLAALEVAAALPADRRILVTPGVIELGPEQFTVNRELAREAASICTTTVIVSDTNREAFVAGHRDAARPSPLVQVPNRTAAFRWLHDHAGPGDLVVLENDLPDLYERADGVFWMTRRPARQGWRRP